MVRRLLPLVFACVLVAVAALPAVALGCPIEIRTIGPIDAERSQLQKPLLRTVDRATWGFDRSWVSTQPRLSQFVRVRGLGRFHSVTFPKQQALSLDARGPFDNGWKYFDDDDPDTKSCELVGQIAWQRPRIHVRQGRDEVRVVAVTQRTEGDRTGCVLGPDRGEAWCPNLTRVVFRLKQPLGDRRLVMEQFG